MSDKKTINLSTIESPSYLLNFPSSFSTKVKNNIWMKEDDEPVDIDIAISQWFDLFSFISANSIAIVLPTPFNCELQDLVFVANLGIIIDENTVIISNFTSEPRKGETKVGEDYFKLSGYKNVITCPYKFEGEADLKHIRDNIYIGGYGLRTQIEAFEWMEKNFNMKIIKIKMTEEKCYHFDCLCFPLTKNIIMGCKTLMSKEEIEEIENNEIEIIDVPLKLAECGVTNNVRLHNFVINSSDITDLDPVEDKEDYRLEREKNQFLEDICTDLGIEAVFINLSEFTKAGAMASCMLMHLNRFSYETELV